MARREFEKVVASAPREKLRITNLTTDEIVPGEGGVMSLDIYAPAGSIGISQSSVVEIPAPVGATSGSHEILATTTEFAGGFVRGVSVYNGPIGYNRKVFLAADVAQEPSEQAAQATAFSGNYFDDTVGFRFNYTNNTDVDNEEQKYIKLTWIERQVGV